jgi:hypothetical protein
MTFDFTGCGYVTAENIYNHNHCYRLPFTKDELKTYLLEESVFAKQPHLNIEAYTRQFYPNYADPQVTNKKKKAKQEGSLEGSAERDDENSDGVAEDVQNHELPDRLSDLKNLSQAGGKESGKFCGTSAIDTTQSVHAKSMIFRTKIDKMEKILMDKLNRGYENVRKAFLDLDRD